MSFSNSFKGIFLTWFTLNKWIRKHCLLYLSGALFGFKNILCFRCKIIKFIVIDSLNITTEIRLNLNLRNSKLFFKILFNSWWVHWTWALLFYRLSNYRSKIKVISVYSRYRLNPLNLIFKHISFFILTVFWNYFFFSVLEVLFFPIVMLLNSPDILNAGIVSDFAVEKLRHIHFRVEDVGETTYWFLK